MTCTSGVAGVEDVPTQNVTTYLQGMDGDYLADGTRRSVGVPDTVGDNVTDSNWLRGRALETDTDLGASTTIEKKSVNGPWVYTTTATETMADSMPALTAQLPRSNETRSYQLWHDGTWRSTRTDSAYDTSGRPVTVDAKGDGTSAVPEVCTTTGYANSTSSVPNMLAYADEVESVQGPCGTTATASNAVSGLGLGSDNSSTLGALSNAGDITRTQALGSYDSGGTPRYVTQSATQYDGYGRVSSISDADNNTTTTAYSSPGASPDTVTVTNPLGWSSSSTLDPARAMVIASTDVNGELTTKTYDGLGRLTAVLVAAARTGFERACRPDLQLRGEQHSAIDRHNADTAGRRLVHPDRGHLRRFAAADPGPGAHHGQRAGQADHRHALQQPRPEREGHRRRLQRGHRPVDHPVPGRQRFGRTSGE